MNSYLEISHLTKRYGSKVALDDVSLILRRGDVLALLGPNGAGKSTLFGCLLGVSTPTSGNVYFEGRPAMESTRPAIGYVAERVSLYPQRTVADNLKFFAELRGIEAFEAKRQLARVGLEQVRESKVRQLSKGMLQRLGLAIALCAQPEVLVLDEPFNGLDPAWLDTLQAILREEHARGATLIVSTHTISAVEPLATHLAVLLQGRLTAFGPLPELHETHLGSVSLEEIYNRVARSQPNQEVLA